MMKAVVHDNMQVGALCDNRTYGIWMLLHLHVSPGRKAPSALGGSVYEMVSDLRLMGGWGNSTVSPIGLVT